MKKYFLLITLLAVGLFWPKTAQASTFHWPDKIKSFFQNPLPANLKFCVDYEGNFYVAGDIFKTKTCNKKDKEIILNTTTATTSGAIGPQGEPGVKGDKGDTGAQGIQGIQGEKGDKGEKGDPGTVTTSGLAGWERISTSSASTTDQLKTVTVTCPVDKKVLSGGFVVNSSTVTFYTVSNFPSADNTWTTSVHRSSTTTPWDLSVYAICATAL